MRETILREIKRLAEADGGKPPGSRTFENETGIRQSAWRGVLWARWGDAVTEAGFEPNVKQEKHEEKFFLEKLAEACIHLRKFPTAMELRMYSKIDEAFPSTKSITRQFGSLKNVPRQLLEWAVANNRADIEKILSANLAPTPVIPSNIKEGFVYLIRSGSHYKIGRSDELERRVKEIRVALPDSATLEHSIRTDDPAGIEGYWHRRFADKRANGEWFKLDRADVAAFKRRKYQ
ncbi:GIY-YIG nuclease family protein [Bradyrhizobium erythrophlei]|uniref:Meiotically up-regulated gene 113 n=1 Tax=Bradyrhizobium erythrophlei TaxID=1437360 RepID=A0A1M7TLP0_9BRAD|nr:GIY-YIG nuclease family protein [Bradyrhizobium erythrophlei]SHN71625.1 Meiotically up-regulated gene 113 [Bradyrhizobium erythrophlei]